MKDEGPKIVVRDGSGKELPTSNTLIHEDAEGIYLIEITLADTDQG